MSQKVKESKQTGWFCWGYNSGAGCDTKGLSLTAQIKTAKRVYNSEGFDQSESLEKKGELQPLGDEDPPLRSEIPDFEA